MTMAARGRTGGSGSLRAVVILVAVGLLVAIAFGGGILVGRHWESAAARDVEPREPGATAKKVAAGKRGGPAEADADRREAGDKLTFYHTLAAPLSPPPSYPKPATDSKSRSGTSAPAGHPATDASPTPSPAAGWTVQVGAFGNRQQADSLQQDLRRAGFDAYMSPLGTPDGQTRFRVRVGTFADRSVAQRAADRLRAERSLPTFVTTH